jgi:hypothetical protein
MQRPNIKGQQSLGLGLDEKAIEAVREWRFKPFLHGDRQGRLCRKLSISHRRARTAIICLTDGSGPATPPPVAPSRQRAATLTRALPPSARTPIAQPGWRSRVRPRSRAVLAHRPTACPIARSVPSRPPDVRRPEAGRASCRCTGYRRATKLCARSTGYRAQATK